MFPTAYLKLFTEISSQPRATNQHNHLLNVGQRKPRKLPVIFIFFYISLTVHLRIILVSNQMDALFRCIYLFPFSTCFEQPSAHHQENRIVSIHHLVYVTLCRWLPAMPVPPHRHCRQSPTQSDIYQVMYWYNSILLMMSTGLLETCREGK